MSVKNKGTTRRRDLLAGFGLFAPGASLPAPAITQGLRQLTMVTDWPDTMPGLHTSAVRFTQTVAAASGGRLQIKVFPADTMVRAFETFDAVSAGVADMYHSAETYFQNKSPPLTFFTAMPYGLTADEMLAWLRHGGGQELWDALSAQFNIKPLACTSSGCQMGGWFTHEITSLDALKGLRYRMGSGAEILRRLGATVVTLPGGEIATALKSGAIDAAEWIGPWPDMAIGLHKACGYYYYPGFHEPGTLFSLGINKRVWESFDIGDQRLVEACAAAEYEHSLAQFNTNNAVALSTLRAEGCVKIVKFSDDLLKAFLDISKAVVADIGTGDELSSKIYASYQGFRDSIMDWSDISKRAYMNSRSLT